MKRTWAITSASVVFLGAALLLGGCEEEAAKAEPIALPTYSPSGVLDTSFGGGAGFITHASAAGGVGDDQGFAIAIDGNSKLVVAGSSVKAGGDALLAVWRFNPGGSPDVSFGGTGFFTHANGAAGALDRGFAVKIDGNGKIVVAGRRWNGADDDLIVMRLHPNGAFDTAFGSGAGFIVRDTSVGNLDGGRGLAIDGAGRIVVAGTRYFDGFQLNDMTVWRFDAAGNDDASFAAAGNVSIDFGSGVDEGAAMAVDSSGNIVVAGTFNDTANDMQGIMRVLGTNGALDTTLFGLGLNTSPLLGATAVDPSRGNATVLDKSGRIVVAGAATDTLANQYMVVWRWLANGNLDTSFNGTGYKSLVNLAGSLGEQANGVALDAQGRILAAGYATGTGRDMALVRLKSNGSLDGSFGASGIVTHNGAAGASSFDEGNAVVVDPNGKIVVVGGSRNTSGDLDLAVWRYR